MASEFRKRSNHMENNKNNCPFKCVHMIKIKELQCQWGIKKIVIFSHQLTARCERGEL